MEAGTPAGGDADECGEGHTARLQGIVGKKLGANDLRLLFCLRFLFSPPGNRGSMRNIR